MEYQSVIVYRFGVFEDKIILLIGILYQVDDIIFEIKIYFILYLKVVVLLSVIGNSYFDIIMVLYKFRFKEILI